MPYPPAPWPVQITGTMYQTLHLLDSERVREFVPSQFDLINVLPGKTLGGIYLAYYGPGSIIEYHEMGVFLSFVRYSGKAGVWISNMYVDSEQSLEFGCEDLGLPKEMAEFDWPQDGGKITVRQGEQIICSLGPGKGYYGWKQKLGGPAFGLLDSQVLRFRVGYNVRFGLTLTRLDIPQDSPLAKYGLGKPTISICAKDGDALLASDLERL